MQPLNKLVGRAQTLWRLFKRLFHFITVDRWVLLLAALITLGITISNTVIIWLLGSPIDLIQQQNFSTIGAMIAGFILLILLNQGLHMSDQVVSWWLGLRFIGRVRNTLFRQIMSLSQLVTRRFEKGDLLTRLSDDIIQAERLIIETPLNLVSHLSTFIFYTGMLFWLNSKLALIALAFSPLLLLHQRIFAKHKRRISRKLYKRSGTLLGFEENALANLQGISSFHAEQLLTDLQARVFTGYKRWSMYNVWLNSGFAASFSLLIYIPAAVIVYIGITDIQAGMITLGQLASFLLYLGYLSVPVHGLAQLPFEAQGLAATGERILEILDIPPEVREKPGAPPLQISQGEITIHDLYFSYANEQSIFKGINLHIHGGETVALVGRSGRGKTTLVRLLMRFHDPQRGSILVDKQDLREVSLASLRNNISVVWQEPFLINASIKANLQMACPEADETAMIAACQASQAWDFIRELASGLDTVLGTGGISLSAGQSQRLSLAQAFLRNAPILLLDEASSALDSQTESKLIENLEQFRQGRTTLIIAHRYSSIRNADRIIYLNDDGSLSIGKHESLLKTHPHYAEAVHWQTVSKQAEIAEVVI